tara:strand:- start:52 stop:204 length:153 start_codon:yes stop_codon:yes gene_type:complete
MEKQLAYKIADKFTDTFFEQISDYLMAYDVEVNDDNVDKVIKEIIKIYNK